MAAIQSVGWWGGSDEALTLHVDVLLARVKVSFVVLKLFLKVGFEGALEVLFFSNTYNQYALTLTTDRVALIRGRVDRREDQLRFTALEVTFPDISQGPAGPLVITMPVAQCTPPIVDRLKEILRTHPGKREVHLQLEEPTGNTVMKLDFKVTSSPSLSADLKAILGANCLQNV